LEITVYERDTNLVLLNALILIAAVLVGVVVVGVVLEVSLEIIDDNRCENCLPRSRKAWAEQRLLAGLEPRLELGRV